MKKKIECPSKGDETVLKYLIIFSFLIFLILIPYKSFATMIVIDQEDISARAAALAGEDLWGADGSGYFGIGVGDFDPYIMFKVYAGDVGHTLSYWSGPPLPPGVDSGDYFIRIITGYENFDNEAQSFVGDIMPMVYEIGTGISHKIISNPHLEDYTLNGIFLDVFDTSIDGPPDIHTTLYADVTTVPEPSTLLLLASSFVGLVYFRKKGYLHGLGRQSESRLKPV